jgi:hypothetical protein
MQITVRMSHVIYLGGYALITQVDLFEFGELRRSRAIITWLEIWSGIRDPGERHGRWLRRGTGAGLL